MNRKGVNILLIEIISFTAFGLTILVWFTGIESLIGNLDNNLAVTNFNKFLNPIKSVCGGAKEARTLGLDLNVLGETYLVTQLNVPQSFRDDPAEFSRIPLGMKKCIGRNCVCLLSIQESEGNWQMCTTSEWDVWAMSTGMSPGCPFWFYAPPDIIEQVISNLISLVSIKDSLAFSFVTQMLDDVEGGYNRNYYYYPAPETWGGCEGATEADLSFSSFYDDKGLFTCELIASNTLSQSYSATSNQPFNTASLINDGYEYDSDYLNDLMINELINPLINQLNSRVTQTINSELDDLTNDLTIIEADLIKDSLNNELNSIKQLIADSISGLSLTNQQQVINLVSAQLINDLLSDYSINSGAPDTSVHELTDAPVRIQFNNPYSPDNLDSVELIINLMINDEVLFYVNNESPISRSSSDGYLTLTIPKNYLTYGLNELLVSGDGSISLTSDSINLVSEVRSGNDWLLLNDGLKDFDISIDFNKKYDNKVITNSITSQVSGEIINQVKTNNEPILTIQPVELSSINSEVRNELLTNYLIFKSEVLAKELFDENCDTTLDISAELRLLESDLIDAITVSLTNLITNEVLTNAELTTELNNQVLLSSYDYSTTVTNLDSVITDSFFNQQASEVSDQLTSQLWAYVGEEVINQLDCTSPINDLESSLTNDLSIIIESAINNELATTDFLGEFTSDDFSISDVNNQLNQEVNSLSNELIPTLTNNLFTEWYYEGFDEFSINSLVDDINSQILNSVFNVISESRLNAWSGLDFTKKPCWLGPNGQYFESFSTINDLLAYNRYTSVSHLEPALLFFGGGSTLTKLPSMGFYLTYKSTSGETLARKINGEPSGLSVEEFNNLVTEEPLDLDWLSGGFTMITGQAIGTRLLTALAEGFTKTALRGLLVNTIKNSLGIPDEAVYGLANLPDNSIILNFQSGISREISYSDGSIRTFDPERIKTISCFTMEELGCEADEVLWVDEEKSCYTELFMRNIGDIDTWLKMLLGSDECLNTYGRNKCTVDELSGDGVCYKDTLTACYRMTCVDNVNERRIFQYWIGSASDPAGLGGPMSNNIPQLVVQRDGNQIVLEVPSDTGVPYID